MPCMIGSVSARVEIIPTRFPGRQKRTPPIRVQTSQREKGSLVL
jgi:hypothetical protein